MRRDAGEAVTRQSALARIASQHDRHAGWWAFIVHRVSGVALAIFLPVHFWALGEALRGEARLDAFLRWADAPGVRASEWAIVVLLGLHLTGGLRVLALEWLPWRGWQKTLAGAVAGASLLIALAFLADLL
ncbi:MAG: succinate dehydrogenase [Proteobacteria bacterium]|jgi:fumarate reductase subunit D|nr:succinate dehydrogenase [Pseudomonadota bacterium]